MPIYRSSRQQRANRTVDVDATASTSSLAGSLSTIDLIATETRRERDAALFQKNEEAIPVRVLRGSDRFRWKRQTGRERLETRAVFR